LNRNFRKKGEIILTSDQLSAKIRRYMHLKPTTMVLEILPDSIIVKYEKLSEATLPIQLLSGIELAPQYMLSQKIQLQPNIVKAFGPKRILDTLKNIQTEYLEVKNLNDTSSFLCKLKPIKFVRFAATETKVSFFVEQFTEKKVQIPVSSINCPSHLFIRSFPAVVNVTYTVGISRFNTMTNNDIELYLDYNDLKLVKLSKQKLKVKNNRSYISNIRIVPQEVEFILEEK
jgi:hypothetical protein